MSVTTGAVCALARSPSSTTCFRPGPPSEAAALFGDLAGSQVLDVGAGTGKLTRFLLGLGATISVIEPDDEMRTVLVRESPGVTALIGSAETVPAR